MPQSIRFFFITKKIPSCKVWFNTRGDTRSEKSGAGLFR